jgi:hypothetical protein
LILIRQASASGLGKDRGVSALQKIQKCTHVRCANFNTAKTTRVKAVHRVRFKVEMSLGKEIRNRAKRSMNIHEKNVVLGHDLYM